ncbi:type IX secretion system membrane protein PorP/SprF [Ignavibacterium sp.]|uniref:type IX secretion system membrane protein PorP/SprF n=1 Tax=Ignavibacterium sp. TaxID=2651167 RepID=UPI00307DD657
MKILSIIFLLSSFTLAQFNPGAKQISLSNSDVALSNDVFSLFNNPSGLSQIDWREIGIYYSPAPFGLKELANAYVAYTEPFSFGSISIGGMTYGFDLYRESKIVLGYSYNYQNKFFAGAAFNFHTLSIKNYGDDNALYFNIGGLVYLSEDFRLGFSFQNINRASFGNDDDQIPVLLNAGISYDLINPLSINAALEKDLRYKTSLMFGVDYDLIEYLSLRSGFSNEPSRFSAGIGINYSFISLDYAMFTHIDLGLTHQVGLLISFNKEMSRKQQIRNYLGIK